MKNFFKKKPDPIEQAKEWKQSVRKEMRQLERDIKSLEREEDKVVRQIKVLSKEAGRNEKSIRMLAKQIVQSRRAKTRLYEGRAQLNSVQMQLQNQISVIKVAGCMQSSAEVMSAMNAAIKIPEVQKNMFQLAKEMERAGLMEEIVADGLDSLDETGVEEEAEEEVSRVLAEIMNKQWEGTANIPTVLPSLSSEAVANEEQATTEAGEEAQGDSDVNEMRARLAGL